MRKRLIILIVLFSLVGLTLFFRTLTGSAQAKPQLIDVGGTIATDTTWSVANSPYILTDTVTVLAGVTLTIEAGVTVMTPDMGEYLDVQGHLEAVGTAVDPILFTSIDDLAANNWAGIAVSGSANVAYATLRYAYTALFMSDSTGGDVILENSTFEENVVHPIVVDTDALHRLKMNNVTFSNNIPNRVGINRMNAMVDKPDLAGDVLLTPQTGLEAYEDLGNGSTPLLNVPLGVTLTLAAGTTFMSDSSVIVNGHLEANGTALEPVILDDRPGGGNFMSNYFVVGDTGSAALLHTIVRDGNPLGIGIGGQSDRPIILQDVVLDNLGEFPILVEAPSLHRLQMTNVTFQNNVLERILVDTDGGQDAITADVTLTAQPGLAWYEFADASDPQTWPPEFVVPSGVTLTAEPGVEMRFGDGAETFVVNGRFQAIGTPALPITLTSATDSAPGEWEGVILQGGSSQLENVLVRNGRENILIGALSPTATVQINDSTISNSSQTPLGIQTSNLHQASLSNITFANNVGGNNIILYGIPTLRGDAVLNDQPGLDAYIVLDGNLSNWFTIPPTSTLSINSGVSLKFNESGGDFGLRVEGALHTAGTLAEPVILTSQTDSAPGEWRGIWLEGGSANLDYTIVRNSQEAVLVGALDAADQVQIQNSVLQSSSTSPLGVPASKLHQLSLSNVTFSDNQNGDHIIIYENGSLAGDVNLTEQPGLAGYVVLNSPTSQLIVPDGISFALEQGTTLKFMGSNHELLVNGHLQTTGTDLEPVILTSFADSASDQWGGIVVEDGTAQLEYTEVRYGEYNLTVNNTAVSTPVLLQNSHFHSANEGLFVLDGAVTAVCSRFTNNSGSGVLVWSSGNPNVNISSSALVGNGAAGLRNENVNAVYARQNWWGDATGPAGLGPGSGDAALGNVLFYPWLEEDGCTTVGYQLYLPMVINP